MTTRAPGLTAAMRRALEMLEGLHKGHYLTDLTPRERYTFDGLVERGWAVACFCRFLTPAGLTALNNMRAAMGSAEYREDLK